MFRSVLRFVLSAFKIKNNRILFVSFKGKQFSCNPKAVYEYLRANGKKNYEMIWVDRGITEFPQYTKTVKYKSLKYYYYYFTAKCVITNSGFPQGLKKPDGQYRIETWHGGGAYKRIKENLRKSTAMRIEIVSKEIDFHLSSCKRFSEVMTLAQRVPLEKFLEIGMPRNDLFFDSHIMEMKKFEVQKHFDIKNAKIILYAPTWRDDGRMLEIKELIAAVNQLRRVKQEDYVLLCRAHHCGKVENCGKLDCIDATEYPDMQELLCAADILITDYSSCMWDFSLMYKPCFIYANDIEKYENERDFYTPMSEWPFPIATNKEELLYNIENFDVINYTERVKQHHKALGSFEDGYACEKLCKLIEYICSDKVM